MRPDRCGVMFAMNDNILGSGYAVFAYELRSGAADRLPVAQVIRRVAAQAPVILIRADGRREVFTADPAVAEKVRDSIPLVSLGERIIKGYDRGLRLYAEITAVLIWCRPDPASRLRSDGC